MYRSPQKPCKSSKSLLGSHIKAVILAALPSISPCHRRTFALSTRQQWTRRKENFFFEHGISRNSLTVIGIALQLFGPKSSQVNALPTCPICCSPPKSPTRFMPPPSPKFCSVGCSTEIAYAQSLGFQKFKEKHEQSLGAPKELEAEKE